MTSRTSLMLLRAATSCVAACGIGRDALPRAAARDRRRRAADGAAAARPAAPARRAPRIVFLGDSLTAGLGLPREQSVPSLIQARLDAEGYRYEVVNAGVSGDTSAGGLQPPGLVARGRRRGAGDRARRQRRPARPAGRADEAATSTRSSRAPRQRGITVHADRHGGAAELRRRLHVGVPAGVPRPGRRARRRLRAVLPRRRRRQSAPEQRRRHPSQRRGRPHRRSATIWRALEPVLEKQDR